VPKKLTPTVQSHLDSSSVSLDESSEMLHLRTVRRNKPSLKGTHSNFLLANSSFVFGIELNEIQEN
jgi:hypothetical protein